MLKQEADCGEDRSAVRDGVEGVIIVSKIMELDDWAVLAARLWLHSESNHG